MKNKRRKRILFVIGCLSSGGAERQLSGLSNMLCEDYDITIVTWIDFDDHYALDSRIKRVRIGYGKSKVRKLIGVMTYILTNSFDCVISYSQEDNLLALAPLCLKFGVKAIASERNYKGGEGTFVQKLLFNIFYKRATYIVPNSYSQGLYISGQTCFKDKIRVITNYTDLSVYHPKYKPKTSTIKFGVFARFAVQKNFRRVAKAISIAKKNTDTPFEIHWHGKMHSFGKPNQGYLEFKSLIEEYQLQECIFLQDHVSNVADEMIKYDAIMLFSLSEGFSNVLSEAICCGLPVLASDISDNSIMVQNAINGYLIDPYNVDQMAATIVKFLSLTDEEKLEMGHRSREIAENLFNKDDFRRKYIQLIEN